MLCLPYLEREFIQGAYDRLILANHFPGDDAARIKGNFLSLITWVEGQHAQHSDPPHLYAMQFQATASLAAFQYAYHHAGMRATGRCMPQAGDPDSRFLHDELDRTILGQFTGGFARDTFPHDCVDIDETIQEHSTYMMTRMANHIQQNPTFFAEMESATEVKKVN